MTEGAKVLGIEELVRRLEAIDRNTRGVLLERAALAGAEPIRKSAEAKAPRRRGVLAAGIGTEVVKRSTRGVTVRIGFRKEDFYGMFQELGTRNHAAQPFLRPAIDEQKEAAIVEVGRELLVGIMREARG